MQGTSFRKPECWGRDRATSARIRPSRAGWVFVFEAPFFGRGCGYRVARWCWSDLQLSTSIRALSAPSAGGKPEVSYAH